MPMPPDRAPPDAVRTRIERASRPMVARMHALPRLVVPAASLVLLAIGLFAPLPVALVAVALLVAFLVWITFLAWPVVPTTGRILRLAMITLVGFAGLTRL